MPATAVLAQRQLGPGYLVGLIGAGIQASRTPAMHEQEGAEQGLRYIYIRIPQMDWRSVSPVH